MADEPGPDGPLVIRSVARAEIAVVVPSIFPFAGGEVLVSFQGSRHKEGALRLARFLVRPDIALALAQAAMSVQPATVGADTAAFYRDQPGQQVMIRQFATARFTPNHPEWDAMEAAIEDEVEQTLYDKKTPARAVADANARIAAMLGK